ncbi:MAG TPA: HEAT repeat domain-containing protein [archaeon]|nr:HEAT repeat domain-containing protein [archaeon]
MKAKSMKAKPMKAKPMSKGLLREKSTAIQTWARVGRFSTLASRDPDIQRSLAKIASLQKADIQSAKKAAPKVAKFLSHKTPEVKIRALMALRLMEARAFEPQVLQATYDTEPGVRHAALSALGGFKSVQNDSLQRITFLTSEKNEKVVRVRSAAWDALVSINPKGLVNFLRERIDKETDPKLSGFLFQQHSRILGQVRG